MASFDDLLRRVATDPSFRDLVRNRPGEALQGHDLSAAQLRQLDAVVRAGPPAPP